MAMLETKGKQMTDEQRLIAKLYRDIEELEKENKFLQDSLERERKFFERALQLCGSMIYRTTEMPPEPKTQEVEIEIWDEAAYCSNESDEDNSVFLYEGDDDVY